MKRKRRDGEVICRCRAYKFPHRMLGGRCDGALFVEQTHERWVECKGCMLLDDDGYSCQVIMGLEPPDMCPALQEFERYEGIKRYGMNKIGGLHVHRY